MEPVRGRIAVEQRERREHTRRPGGAKRRVGAPVVTGAGLPEGVTEEWNVIRVTRHGALVQEVLVRQLLAREARRIVMVEQMIAQVQPR